MHKPEAGSWRNAIPPEELELYEQAGFGAVSGLGERPAVLVIDVQYRTVGDEPLPIRESIARYYRTSCGEAGWAAIRGIEDVLAAARAANLPVIYPYVAPKGKLDAGRTGEKIPSLMEVPERGYAFVAEVAPGDGDLLIPKRHPSAFFGTALASYLIDLRADTVLLTGCTTSGCVRATACDAFAYNFRCGVIEDCVYDRSPTSHAVNLFDISSKYADVMPADAAIAYLEGLAR
jgi:maleamate amidohydrolase